MARDTKKRIDTVPTPRASVPDVVGASDESATVLVPAATAAATGVDAKSSTKTSTTTTTVPGPTGTAAKAASIAASTSVRTSAPAGVEVPRQASSPSPLVAPREPEPARRSRLRPAIWIGVAAALVITLAVGTSVYAAQQDSLEAKDAALAAQLRVLPSTTAAARDALLDQQSDATVVSAASLTTRGRAATQAKSAVAQADAALVATPNAGGTPRIALAAASNAVTAALAAPGTSPASLHRLAVNVAAKQKVVVDAQAAWQAAENARIAAEQAAAAAAAAASQTSRSSGYAPRVYTPRSSGGTSSGAPAAPSSQGIPAGGKVCSGSGGSGAGESSVGAIGAAINAYRASLGLSTLSVSRSGGLVSHSIDMANRGGIWHSGADNIVACVSNGSASTMVSAWSHSPSHDAQMRRTDVSHMGVGGASLGGWLFGAVKFS